MTAPEPESPEAAPPAVAAKPMDVLIARVKGIIMRPSKEWEAIDNEKATLQSLFRDYLAPLAAIPAAANFLGALVAGPHNPFGALLGSVIAYAFSVAAVYAMGWVIFQLADNFSARQDQMKAMKVAVYSSTPIWLAGIVFLVPVFNFFFILSLWSIFILYRGLQILMKSPPDKVTGYESAIVGVAVVLFIICAAVTAGLTI
ncbi:MAG: Yip1 family protein [Alphaproteobacteria bacterium]